MARPLRVQVAGGTYCLMGNHYHLVVETAKPNLLLEVARYIARNPVKAWLCRRPEDWPWSSHRAVLGLAPSGFVDVRRLLFHFGPDVDEARRRYTSFVNEPAVEEPMRPGPAVVGTEAFVKRNLPAARPSAEIPNEDWHGLRPSLAELLAEGDRDENIATAYRLGYRMKEIAEVLGCHYATVSRRLRAWEAR